MSDSKNSDRTNQSEALMESNNLFYRFDDPLSVSVLRTGKKQFFSTRSYTDSSGSMIVDVNSGTDLICPKNSYLKLTFKLSGGDGTGRYSFGSGSAMNFINDVKILSAAGTEMARTENSNLYNKFHSNSRHSTNWFTTVGAVMGHGTAVQAFTSDDATTYTYCIPLTELDPFFALYDDKNIPASLASGLRIELGLESLANTFLEAVGGGGAATSYTVTNIELRTENITLMDSAQAILNQQASQKGHELTYDRLFCAPQTVGTTLSDNLEIRKAVALAKSMMYVQIPTASIGDITTDYFETAPYTYTSVDARLGNAYWPHQPIESAEEAYLYHLKNYGKVKHPHYESSITFAQYKLTNAILSFDFERDDSLNLSAMPVNQSRIAEQRFTRSANTNVKAYAWLRYTALARASLSNTSVKI
jgi:hypothetical protein